VGDGLDRNSLAVMYRLRHVVSFHFPFKGAIPQLESNNMLADFTSGVKLGATTGRKSVVSAHPATEAIEVIKLHVSIALNVIRFP
jgi:hypothetical protein